MYKEVQALLRGLCISEHDGGTGLEEKYKRLKSLGKGSTAEVYLVEERKTGKTYAMKIGGNTGILEQEARMLQALQHPIFPCVKEYSAENREYLVMEYVEGDSLQKYLDQGIVFSLEEIVAIMDELLKGLHYLHMQHPSIVYRDVKPANMMWDKNGKLRLIDLGAACYSTEENEESKGVRATRLQAGTYGYAAPEQFWQGVVPDKACDIYAAGKVLAYLLSGKNPAEPPYDMEHFCKGLGRVPVAFGEIIERSLAVEPLARYEDCESMRREIHRAYEETMAPKLFKIHKKRSYTYKKCIWKSEYRRIF